MLVLLASFFDQTTSSSVRQARGITGPKDEGFTLADYLTVRSCAESFDYFESFLIVFELFAHV